MIGNVGEFGGFSTVLEHGHGFHLVWDTENVDWKFSWQWQNYLFPANIQGLSVFTVLLAMIGNALLLPRALFTRDLMW